MVRKIDTNKATSIQWFTVFGGFLLSFLMAYFTKNSYYLLIGFVTWLSSAFFWNMLLDNKIIKYTKKRKRKIGLAYEIDEYT